MSEANKDEEQKGKVVKIRLIGYSESESQSHCWITEQGSMFSIKSDQSNRIEGHQSMAGLGGHNFAQVILFT